MAKGTCSVDGCEREAKTRGWCVRHYKRWERHGDPLAGRKYEEAPYDGALCRAAKASGEPCPALAVKRGWCGAHYARWRVHGDPDHEPQYNKITVMPTGGDTAPYRLVTVPSHGSLSEVLVDDSDLERFGGYRWHVARAGYVIVFVPGMGRRGPGVKGAGRSILLHRAIMELTKGDGLVVDHINGRRADNRRANLRVVTQRQNGQNVAGHGKYSGHRGVSFDKDRGVWVAYLKIPGGRMVMLGRFATEELAASVAAAARAEHMPYAVAR